MSQRSTSYLTRTCGAFTTGSFYPVTLEYLLIHSRQLPTHTSLGFQMSFVIQFIKAVTPGNCFLIVILKRGERLLLKSAAAQSSGGVCVFLLYEAYREQQLFLTRREFPCQRPPLLLLLFQVFKLLSPACISSSSPPLPVVSLGDLISLPLPSTHLSFHLLMTASFHSCSTSSLRRLGGKNLKRPDALFNPSTNNEREGFHRMRRISFLTTYQYL